MSEIFIKDLDWDKQDFTLVISLRPIVFFIHCLITPSFATKTTELVNMDTPSYIL